MKKATWRVGAIVVAAALFCSQSEAAPITFYSGDGGDVVNGHAATVITPHSAWGDVSGYVGLSAGTAKWIWYANTGVGAPFAPNVDSREIGHQTALFTRTFELLDVSNFSLWTLADDTATVRLLGPGGYINTLFTAFSGQIDPCAPGGTGVAIGCVQADMGKGIVNNLAAGLYTLELYAFQTNGDVFGAQYAGQIQPVPEPATLLLLGGAIAGLVARRKRLLAPSVV